MKTRVLGNNGLTVSEIGLGCMTIGKDYSDESRKNGIAIIQKAFECGVTLFDTAQCYGPDFQNEVLVGEAIKPFRNDIVLATKGGVKFVGSAQLGSPDVTMVIDSRPETIRQEVEDSLKRLQTDRIDLYYTHRVDPTVPIEVVAETMVALHKEGKILHWGISEPSMETLRKANAVFPVAAIESEYNMMFREPEEEILPTLEELGIGLTPYRPLARGFLTDGVGMYKDGAANTRFDEKNLAANMALRNLVQKFSQEKGVTAAQISLAWLLYQKPFIVPIPGTGNIERMQENVAASNVVLTADEMKHINELLSQITIVGDRYDMDSPNGKSVRQ